MTRGAKNEPQMRTLLRLHDEGLLAPEPVAGLGALPARASRGERLAFDLIELRFGLRMADGTTEAMPLAASELVNAGIVVTPGGASKLLQRFERLDIIWSPDEMPKLGQGNGTKLFLPGPKPRNPFRVPLGGWCAEPAEPAEPPVRTPGMRTPAISDGVPDPVFERAAVPVEAEDVGAAAVEPLVEAPDEAGVSDAVSGGAQLRGVVATGSGTGLRRRGHGAEAYAGRPMESAWSSDLVKRALAKAQPGTRNATGFWLAQQLRDLGLEIQAAQVHMELFHSGVPAGDHPYALKEAHVSLVSAYKGERRAPCPATRSEMDEHRKIDDALD